jgi:dCMP deaminase
MNNTTNKKIDNRSYLKDEVYFKTAKTIAKLSRDEKHQVGAVIVDKNGKVISTGYNGPPSKFNDDLIDFSGNYFEIVLLIDPAVSKLFTLDELNELNNFNIDNNDSLTIIKEFKKGPFMLHAEMNAILTTDDRSRLEGGTIYITHVPCDVCAKLIAQTGITTVKTLNNKANRFKEFIFKTLAIFKLANIKFEVFYEVDFT